jgi:L-rhamnose-H+ transport protein
MQEIMIGFSILLLGAVCGGSFGLPSKFVSKDVPWENLWGPFFLFATLLLPLVAGPMLVPGLTSIYATSGIIGLVLPFLFGVLWGFGSMTLGLSFAFIGLSLAYAINYGGQIIVGSIAPMLIHTPEKLTTPSGIMIVIGVAVCLVGVTVCGRAGMLKSAHEATLTGTTSSAPAPKGLFRGLILALLSGALCACWAIGFSFGHAILDTTATAGITDWRQSLPTTFLMLFGGFFSACSYCVYKLQTNKTWKRFYDIRVMFAVCVALVMAILHDAAVGLFGYGASMLGTLGVSVGYAVFMSFAIMVGNINGFLTGEWKNAGKKAVTWIGIGVAILVLAVCLLGIGNGLNE